LSGRFRDVSHLIRMAALFAVGIGLFIVVSRLMVPKGFGQYGHFRAGALADNAAVPLAYADGADCAQCHDDIVAKRQGSKHATIHCQICHGPLAAHAADPSAMKPVLPDAATLCVRCHAQLAARPAKFPQVAPADHSGGSPCKDCHNPHHPEPEA
jgi:hypothetical protein